MDDRCNAQLSDAIRFILVMDHLGDDRVHDHLQLNASRIDTWKASTKK